MAFSLAREIFQISFCFVILQVKETLSGFLCLPLLQNITKLKSFKIIYLRMCAMTLVWKTEENFKSSILSPRVLGLNSGAKLAQEALLPAGPHLSF